MLNKLKKYFQYHLHHYAHVGFKEPIVVFESDDWGKMGMEKNVQLPAEKGERTPHWSYDKLESAAELNALYNLLASYQNGAERGPVFTANFIISNPDVAATKASNYQRLALKTIDQSHPELIPHWHSGMVKKVFYPQYHGRLHYNEKSYLHSLQNDAVIRSLFEQGINGGAELFEEGDQAYYSEYQDYASAKTPEKLSEWIAMGLQEFKQVFGFESTSMISPNYVFDVRDFSPLRNKGLQFVQGGNKFLRQEAGREVLTNFCQGTTLPHGLTALARNHKFEPCRGKREWQAEFSLQSALGWIARGIPAVIDSHRVNYVGSFAEESRAQLKILLDGLVKVEGIRFLSSPELGEAITNRGKYTDVFTGEVKQLTLQDSPFKKRLRQWLH